MEVGLGTLRLGGNLQTVYGYSQTGKWSFAAKRVRLILNGDFPEQRLKYLVQLEALTSPALLDARIQASGYLPKTDLMLGRFIPSFSLYMPRSTAALEMINYPVVLTKFAMWRQMGMQTTTKLQPVELSIGVFNGYPANNYADNNNGKDLLFSATAKPADFLQLLGYSWLGNSVQKGSQDTLKNRYGGGIQHRTQAWPIDAPDRPQRGHSRTGSVALLRWHGQERGLLCSSRPATPPEIRDPGPLGQVRYRAHR